MTRVLIAPDKFKGSLTAEQVARALRSGIAYQAPDWTTSICPIADGGDGTVAALVAHGWQQVRATARDALGHPRVVGYARLDDTVVIEQAATVGLGQLPVAGRDPMGASSFGMGELIAHALSQARVSTVVLALGGSASTDGGAGLLQALGARVLDRHGCEVAQGGAALATLHRIDLEPLDQLIGDTRFLVARDVDNPLLGPDGAVRVFAHQKGADLGQQQVLEAGLQHWSRVLGERRPSAPEAVNAPGAGAGGGVGYAAIAALGAETCRGVDWLLDIIAFDDHVEQADLIVTGEGNLDTQTLFGKAPTGVTKAAAARGVPVVAVAGRCMLTEQQTRAAGFDRVYALTDIEPDLDRCMTHGAALLQEVAATIVEDTRMRVQADVR
ncbi:glycerate kinase [Gordonia desulfuricans]|uniref:Glycerate kinase n=1 Tax=Gordonia desulfuricans TaxID=89051 RepID=A0A7K3LSM6_9ACTN|nr:MULTISPECIES: glycerate kinase [Gordonia]EMP13926.2 hypothetical protein ISGA_210 [Gordonia sp. NB41Y]NDK91240.1 glycerate kinase [Gordonia desulfuricans]WLP88678.1 glycerate kinase [Gordonia sp. NB41Y]